MRRQVEGLSELTESVLVSPGARGVVWAFELKSFLNWLSLCRFSASTRVCFDSARSLQRSGTVGVHTEIDMILKCGLQDPSFPTASPGGQKSSVIAFPRIKERREAHSSSRHRGFLSSGEK